MKSLRIGTRGSPLALKQAHLACQALEKIGIHVSETIIIATTGDKITDRSLEDIGGKALFAKELQTALLNGEIDVAVHSLKDLEWHFPKGLQLKAVLEREDPRDCFISTRHKHIEELPPNAMVGTCAPRRIAQIRHRNSSIIPVPLRGNIQTRLNKLQELDLDGIILAAAGLHRLNMHHIITHYLDQEYMVPAAGQGAIALECRVSDAETNRILNLVNHQETWNCVTAEKAVLAKINGTCHTPIGVYATQDNHDILSLTAFFENRGHAIFTTVEGQDPLQIADETARRLIG
ncbi:MAG: hydroxymethylbilane synthase [Candidatus Paracaedibacteraceae bacterium]|nr:hydroxymethylbilane synthase [Candidatus Paracaedibacteraceae bacterium]